MFQALAALIKKVFGERTLSVLATVGVVSFAFIANTFNRWRRDKEQREIGKAQEQKRASKEMEVRATHAEKASNSTADAIKSGGLREDDGAKLP